MTKLCKEFFKLFLLIILFNFSDAVRTCTKLRKLNSSMFSLQNRQVEFRNIENRWSRNYFSNFSIYLQNNSINLDIDIIKTIQTGFKGYIEFQIRLNGSKIYQTLFSYTLDICNMVISLKDTIFKKWFKSFLKYGNFMQNCPVFAGHYYLRGWKLDPNLIPSYLYAGDYRIKGYGYYGKHRSKNEEFVVAVSLELSCT